MSYFDINDDPVPVRVYDNGDINPTTTGWGRIPACRWRNPIFLQRLLRNVYEAGYVAGLGDGDRPPGKETSDGTDDHPKET